MKCGFQKTGLRYVINSKKISIPTLIVTGTEDQVVPSTNSLVLADKMPVALLVQIKVAGHGLMY